MNIESETTRASLYASEAVFCSGKWLMTKHGPLSICLNVNGSGQRPCTLIDQ